MKHFLFIETSSINCSVAIGNEEKILVTVEKQEANIHATAITLFIEKALKQANISLNNIDYVIVGKGPGSYTGLRIGVSTAKGLCYALDKPLLSCNSLRTMSERAKEIINDTEALYCPLIDARRMEVYTCLYNSSGEALTQIEALIIDEHSFKEKLKTNKIIFFGDGAEKIKSIYADEANAIFIDHIYPSASYMLKEAVELLKADRIEDLIYFEPYYLKEFYIPKK